MSPDGSEASGPFSDGCDSTQPLRLTKPGEIRNRGTCPISFLQKLRTLKLAFEQETQGQGAVTVGRMQNLHLWAVQPPSIG